jgi:hypothetical protein
MGKYWMSLTVHGFSIQLKGNQNIGISVSMNEISIQHERVYIIWMSL